MGKNAKRRRLVKARARAERATVGMSQILSELSLANGVPNRATRRSFKAPRWFKASR